MYYESSLILIYKTRLSIFRLVDQSRKGWVTMGKTGP